MAKAPVGVSLTGVDITKGACGCSFWGTFSFAY